MIFLVHFVHMSCLDICNQLECMGVTMFTQVCVSVNIIMYTLQCGGVTTAE